MLCCKHYPEHAQKLTLLQNSYKMREERNVNKFSEVDIILFFFQFKVACHCFNGSELVECKP